ncbi:MAG: TIGR02266 family protein [bacterium]|nr:TIGR02266 family protein [bacterium]
MHAARQDEGTERPHRPEDLRESTRVDLKQSVDLRFENLERFISESSLNISATGMFIKSDDPQPAGSCLSFALALDGGEKLIQGFGEVVWYRRQDEGPDHPAGMGIRFLHLDAESRELIRWTVTRRYITGAGPRDVDEIRSEIRRAAERETDPEPAEQAHGISGDRNRRRLHAYAGCASVDRGRGSGRALLPALALAALAFAGLVLLPPAPVPIDPAVPTALATDEIAAPMIEQATVTPPSSRAEVTTQTPLIDLAQAWALSWSEQRIDDYLSFYAAGFRPPGGQDRAEWRAGRETRILKPREIEVRLAHLTVELLAADRARVSFDQSYRSDNYQDTVRKTLELVREGDDWWILEERVVG